MSQKTLAIVSGGMDSVVLAYWLATRSTYTLDAVVSVDYGQRHRRELLCAAAAADALGVPHCLVDLSSLRQFIPSSSLTSEAPVPEGHYAEDSMKATVVPNRNMVLASLAVSIAIAREAQFVAYGAHAGDHAIYPDCRPAFQMALAAAVGLCDYNPPAFIAPFIQNTKAEIVKVGLEIGVDFRKTHTCYNGQHIACGRCGTCVERLEAFALAGAEDPLHYADRDFWRTATATDNPENDHR